MMQSCHTMQQPLPRGSIQHQHRRLPHLLFLLFLYSLTSCSNGITSLTKKESTIPLLGTIPDTPFRCLGHGAGYYADPDTGCQVYHMCDSLERQYSYLCPNYTLFNQKFMVCDHWYMVNCSSSHTFYHLNSHIGEVPDKNDGQEEQNAITVEPKKDASLRRTKGSSSRTPLSGPSLPSKGSSSVETLRSSSKDAPRPWPAFTQSGTRPVKATVFKTTTKSVTPSVFTTTTTKPRTSSRRQFASPLTIPPNTPPSRQPFNSPTIQRQQSLSPPSKDPIIPIREEISPLNTRPITSNKGQFTTTRQPTTPPTRHSFTPLTRQTTTSTRQSFTSSNRKLTTFTSPSFVPSTRKLTTSTRPPITLNRHSFTPSTTPQPTTLIREAASTPTRQPFTPPVTQPRSRNVTAPTAELQKPSSFFTLPRIEFSINHKFVGNNQGSNEEDSSTPTHLNNSSLSTTTSSPSIAHTHKAQEEHPAPHTDSPSTGITMKPASVARGPGNRFSFTNHKEDEQIALTPEELQRIVFQPLLARPRTKTRRILTSVPSLLPIDPANSTDPHHHHFPMRIEFPDPVIPEDSFSRSTLDQKLSNSQRTQIPPRLLNPPSVSPAVHNLSSFFSLPTHPFTPIRRMKQEFPTPLLVPQRDNNLKTSPRETFLPGARRLPFPASTRGNRDFFIPTAEFSLLLSELPHNILEEPAKNPSPSASDSHQHHHDHHHHHGDHMTMVFPAPIEPSMMKELKLNPECPRCHPEFLKPGQCHPCVVIK